MEITADAKVRLEKEIGNFKVAMLVVRNDRGELRSLPMSIAHHDQNNNLWFFTTIDSTKMEQIDKDDQVCCCMQLSDRFVSITGRGEVVRDKNKIDELWTEGLRPWFPNGTATEDIALLKVCSNWGEYWDYSGPVQKLSYAYHAVKSTVTGEKLCEGEEFGKHERVGLKDATY
eukprot:TRINITY_DN3273_c0_g1_i1.p1 TRINITY_DN3273_c0_g1~~TRINITY_DN3273_c0_g1_i1.p1  ORF type:complete len:173 (+),score=30.00 TRINITY_DN3273_c0_g1_i1:115-633(+)